MANKSIYITSDKKHFSSENGISDVLEYLEQNPKVHVTRAIVYDGYDFTASDTLRLTRITGIDEPELKNRDYRLFNLIKGSPIFEKGRYISRTYYEDEEELVPVVIETYTDVLDSNNKLIRIDARIEWLNNDGTVGMTKNVKKQKNQYEAGKIFKERRGSQIDYLIEGAKGTPAEPLVTSLFEHYASEVNEYIAIGNDILANAINSEVDTTITGYLNTVVLPPATTMKDSILDQIT